MARKIIDIVEFRNGVKAGKLAPQTAVRLATSGSPVIADDSRVVTFVFSDNTVDRYGDTIDARGWVLDNFRANPVALFGHDAESVENVIGRAKNLRVDGNRLIGDIEFMEASVNPNAEIVYQMVKAGFLNTVSVGFAPLEWKLTSDKNRPGGVDFKKQELLEISIVPIPANPNALVQARAAGIDVDRLSLLQTAIVPEPSPGIEVIAPGTVNVRYWLELDERLSPEVASCATEKLKKWLADPVEPLVLESGARLRSTIDAAEVRAADMQAEIDKRVAEEVARILAAKSPKITTKGLSYVAWLASILSELGWLQDGVAYEAEYEGDGSEVPQQLADALVALGNTLVAMTVEEVSELLAGLSSPDVVDVDIMTLAKTPAQKALAMLIARARAAKEERAGKAISAANEKTIRDAHEMIGQACEMLLSIVDTPASDGDGNDSEPDNTDDEAKAARARRALAMKLAAE